MNSNAGDYSWVETHKEIVDYLKDNKDNQKEIIHILKDIGINVSPDKDGQNNIPLEEIDPFTFFSQIYKHSSSKRLEYLKKIAQKLNLKIPTGESGIPSANPNMARLFPYKDKRKDEISRLWDFFYNAIDKKLSDEEFADILNIDGIGKVNITQVLFYIMPEDYLPIDGPIKDYLKDYDIDTKVRTFSEYKLIMDNVKTKIQKPFYEISYDAWTNRINYWVFQWAPGEYDIINAVKDGNLRTWRVRWHKNKIKKGDKVIVWLCKPEQKCIALLNIISDVYKGVNHADEKKYLLSEDENIDRVKVEIEHDLSDNPVTKDMIDQKPVLKDLNIGKQGTNFKANKEQYDAILKLSGRKLSRNKNYPLNTIFYGPPGTGKTFHTIMRSVEIIDGCSMDINQSKKRFNKLLGNQIEFITFHQNYSYEDFIQGLRPDLSGSQLVFKKKDGVFKRIADKAKGDPDNNYVIIIDEINRANISRVFGELVTLIEEDKRTGGDLPMRSTLPSGDIFEVPSNLYIIGTMNTADKSIALLDIALRRRFRFEAMYPLYEINGCDIHDTDILKKLNEKIIEEKGYDFQIGHSYFMGGSSLKERMNDRVIPLLLEYFMNDEDRVRNILKNIGLKISSDFPFRVI